MKGLAVFVVVAAVAAGVWWWRREPALSRPAPAVAPVSPPAAERRDAPGAERPPAAPAAPRPPVEPAAAPSPAPAPAGDPVAPAVADAPPFEQEPRDSGWAVDHERELTIRLDRLVADLAGQGHQVKVAGAECRQTRCRIAVEAPASGDLSALYGALETPEGLNSWADSVVLGQVDGELATGTLRTTIVVQFERN